MREEQATRGRLYLGLICFSHDVSYMVRKTCSRKADQLAKPGNATVHEWYMSVAISWGNKMK